MKKIAYTKPSITEKEINYVNDAIRTGWGEKCYDYIKQFEQKFGEYIGVNYSLATSSCTGALHLALAALGIKEGDEVIVPDITWIASVEPVLYLGAKPVFVDISEDNWCINPRKIEEAITPKTKAIIVVHLYGNLVEMDEVMKIARKYNLKVIEDAAEAIGSEYKCKKAGSIGDVGVFSFHGTKTCSSGEGGMLVTNSPEIYEEAKILGDHGRDPKDQKMFWMKKWGYKYKMSNLQAAMGLAQIERVEELVEKRRIVFSWYKELLSNIKGIVFNSEPSYTKNSYWMPTIILNNNLNINRDELIQFLKQHNIDARPFFYPLSSLPMFEDKTENVISYDIFCRGINLPTYYDLTREEAEFVSEKVKEFILNNGGENRKMLEINKNTNGYVVESIEENYNDLPSLRDYVSVKKDKNLIELEEAGLKWMKVREENRLDYELDWLGVPIIQAPEDLTLMQELIFKLKPDYIIEIGIAHGGSLIFYSSLFELFKKKGKIIGADIEIREHNRNVLEKHPLFHRVELIEGNSVSEDIFNQIKNKIPFGAKVLVCLDSDHTKLHVLKELQMYSALVTLGSYLVVFDSNSSQLAKLGAADPIYLNNGPLEAIEDFLKDNKNFEIDFHYNRFFISSNPNGFLKRVK
jgi:perosamine synthetase